MGQLMSSTYIHDSNDELINSLIKNKYVRTVHVENVLRCVDRKLYFTDEEKEYAYRDSAWQSNEIHLSSPSVYASVLECLELQQGNKFLNIGSGIGYFNTAAGLLLGMTGVNHGIEIHQVLVDEAKQKLEEFKLSAAAIDHYDFCEPVFIQGNACDLSPTGFYDRVYCGAGVPPEESNFMKSLIKVGGILVMPLDGFLVKVTRDGEHSWQVFKALEVSFTSLIVPEKCNLNAVNFPSVVPSSLQELCRFNIRSLLRENLQKSLPDLLFHSKCVSKTYSEKSQCVNPEEQLVEFINVQYGIGDEGMVGLQNLFDTFSRLGDAITDDTDDNELNELSDNEEEELDNSNDSDDSNIEYRKSFTLPGQQDPLKDETTKRKSPEAGCSESRKTVKETENSKRMKMNSSSYKNSADGASTSTNSFASDAWETCSNTSRSSLVNEGEASLLPIEENRAFNQFSQPYDFEKSRAHRRCCSHCSSLTEDSSYSSDLSEYNFISECKENKLSKLLKDKIDSLPIPNPVKHFLNYYRNE